jgi:hypothetical protein
VRPGLEAINDVGHCCNERLLHVGVRKRDGRHFHFDNRERLALGDRRTCELADSCALQSLSGEMARADNDARTAYEDELRSIIASVADGLEGKPKVRREEATALLAILVGGVTLARAVHDEEFSDEIAAAVRKAALRLTNA